MEVELVAFFWHMFHVEEVNNFYLTVLANKSVHFTPALILGTLEWTAQVRRMMFLSMIALQIKFTQMWETVPMEALNLFMVQQPEKALLRFVWMVSGERSVTLDGTVEKLKSYAINLAL